MGRKGKPNPKQERFVEEYLVDLNATQAAIRAGYSPKTASETGYKLCHNSSVADAIARAKADRSRRIGITQDRVLRELARVAFVNPKDVINLATAEVLEGTGEDELAVIAGMKVKYIPHKDFDDDGEPIIETAIEREVKLCDKLKAIDMLCKHLGMYENGGEEEGHDKELGVVLLPEVKEMPNIVWQPQPKQAVFMSRWEEEALYGGAAGGGKSDALVIEALRQVHIPYYRALIVRRTFPQMEDLIDKSVRYYKRAFPKAKYNDSKHFWRFPSGAKIFFGSMQHEKDKLNYQGKPYDFIGFDELTQFTVSQYDYLVKSRNRPNGPGTRVYCRATANPGGVGHGWVKERFITAAPPMTTIMETVKYHDESGVEREKKLNRIFVPSSVFDNPALMANDPDYVARLASLPEADKKALLYGDWDTFSGQVFMEWRNDPAHYIDRKGTHVINPFKVPDTWRVWRAFDWGYSKPFSCHWYAVDHDKRLYCIRELYGCTGEPDAGVKWEPSYVATRIKAIESEDENLKGRQISGVADPAIFGESGAIESIARLMEAQRVYFEPADNGRLNGKMQVHHRLAFDGDGVPMFYVFSTCPHLIRTLPALVYDDTDVEDVDTAGEDHAYDDLRYICMRNPLSPRVVLPSAVPLDDPLNIYGDKTKYDKYEFYRRM